MRMFFATPFFVMYKLFRALTLISGNIYILILTPRGGK